MNKSDKDFAKLLRMMQRQGEIHNPTTLELGVMTSAKTCRVGELELDEEDLLINELLLKPVAIKNGFNEALKKGDTVIVMKLDSQDTYVILCKVVDV